MICLIFTNFSLLPTILSLTHNPILSNPQSFSILFSPTYNPLLSYPQSSSPTHNPLLTYPQSSSPTILFYPTHKPLLSYPQSPSLLPTILSSPPDLVHLTCSSMGSAHQDLSPVVSRMFQTTTSDGEEPSEGRRVYLVCVDVRVCACVWVVVR